MNAESEGRAAAARFRQKHRLGVQPLGDLVAVVEQTTGIDVAVVDADRDEHGLSVRDPRHDTVLIGVARTPNPMRQRSSLAHELGHVQFGDWSASDAGNWSERDPAEVRADAFARHLLLPRAGLREFLAGSSSVALPGLSAVVQRFLVSPAMAAIALHQAKCIDATTKAQWLTLTTPQLAVRFGWSDQYQALQADSGRRRAPQRLLARAVRGYEEGVVSAQAIATLRGIPLDVAAAELWDAGVIGPEAPIAWADAADLPEVAVDWEALDVDLSGPAETGRE